MIAAIEMQWLGVAVAALVVAVLLLIVLIRHRSADDKLMAAGPAADQAASGPPAAPDTLAAPRPSWAAPPAPLADAPPAPVAAMSPTPPAPVVEAPEEPSPAPAFAPATPPLEAATPAVAPPAAPIVTPEQTGSFLDEPLSRDFEALGSPASPEPGSAAPGVFVDHGPFPVDPFGSHDDIFPPDHARAAQEPPSAAAEGTAAAPEPAAAPAPAAEAEPVVPPDQSAPTPDTRETPEAPAPVLLSDILVTTGEAEVDLTDPGVRHLLEQLVGDEVELARQCRAHEQTLDAILQLTEAEKVCEALGLDERLAEVRALLAELQA